MSYIRAAYVYAPYLAHVTEDDLKILTHINIAFGLVKDGRVSVDHNRQHFAAIENIRKMKPEVKIVLSVGGWGAGGFSEAASTDEGCRLFEYIERKRIDYAKKLILCYNIPLSEIAAQAGFADYFTFSHAFKKNTGISAMQFKKEIPCNKRLITK